MASFIEGLLLIALVEYGNLFTLKLKDGLKWSIFPECAEDRRQKEFDSMFTLTDRNSSLTSSITREMYKRGDVSLSIKRASWRDGAESSDMILFNNLVGPVKWKRVNFNNAISLGVGR
jgi:hypothetical protein